MECTEKMLETRWAVRRWPALRKHVDEDKGVNDSFPPLWNAEDYHHQHDSGHQIWRGALIQGSLCHHLFEQAIMRHTDKDDRMKCTVTDSLGRGKIRWFLP